MESVTAWIAHPAMRSGLATLVGYALILVLLTAIVFLLPYAIFVAT